MVLGVKCKTRIIIFQSPQARDDGTHLMSNGQWRRQQEQVSRDHPSLIMYFDGVLVAKSTFKNTFLIIFGPNNETFKRGFTPQNLVQIGPFDDKNDQQDRAEVREA